MYRRIEKALHTSSTVGYLAMAVDQIDSPAMTLLQDRESLILSLRLSGFWRGVPVGGLTDLVFSHAVDSVFVASPSSMTSAAILHSFGKLSNLTLR